MAAADPAAHPLISAAPRGQRPPAAPPHKSSPFFPAQCAWRAGAAEWGSGNDTPRPDTAAPPQGAHPAMARAGGGGRQGVGVQRSPSRSCPTVAGARHGRRPGDISCSIPCKDTLASPQLSAHPAGTIFSFRGLAAAFPRLCHRTQTPGFEPHFSHCISESQSHFDSISTCKGHH